MQIINTKNYPNAIVEAVKSVLYYPNADILRVSELIDSPLTKKLLIKYWDKIVIDVDDVVYSSLFGTAWHKFLASFQKDCMVEKRWSIKRNNIIISGQTDIYGPDTGQIIDNKTQSAWAFVFGNKSWERQLNCYAYLIQQSGYPVNQLWIMAYLRDWSKYEAMKGRNKDYPKSKFHPIQVPLWSIDEQERYIDKRIDLHLNNKDYVCSSEERWERPTTYAVKKEGVKTAKRVLNTMQEAKDWIDEKKPKGDISIEVRKGGCVRCEGYCMARSVCPHAKIN